MAAMEEPKQSPSAYFLYVLATRKAVQADIGCDEFSAVAKVQAERWKYTPAGEKDKYKKQAAELKSKRDKDVAAFKEFGVVGERRRAKKHARDKKHARLAKAEGAYVVYYHTHYAEIAESLPAVHRAADTAKAAGEKWKKLFEADRKRFEAEYDGRKQIERNKKLAA